MSTDTSSAGRPAVSTKRPRTVTGSTVATLPLTDPESDDPAGSRPAAFDALAPVAAEAPAADPVAERTRATSTMFWNGGRTSICSLDPGPNPSASTWTS